MTGITPPRAATWLLGRFLPHQDKETIIGDLVEEYALLAASLPPADASRWYWTQVMRSVGPMRRMLTVWTLVKK